MNFHPTDQIWFVSRKSPHVYSLACNVDVHRTFFFNFTILYWFCHISKWICHRYTCVPHPEPSSLLPPHIIPLGCPSAPAPSIQYRASNLDWQLVSYMILHMFQCHSPKSSHPLPLQTLPYCIGFAIYQNESATGIHVIYFNWRLIKMAEEYDGETTFSPTNSSKEHLNTE